MVQTELPRPNVPTSTDNVRLRIKVRMMMYTLVSLLILVFIKVGFSGVGGGVLIAWACLAVPIQLARWTIMTLFDDFALVFVKNKQRVTHSFLITG